MIEIPLDFSSLTFRARIAFAWAVLRGRRFIVLAQTGFPLAPQQVLS